MGCEPHALRCWWEMKFIDDLFCSLSPSMKRKKLLLLVPCPLPSRVNIVSHETADDTSDSLKIRRVTLSHRETRKEATSSPADSCDWPFPP